MRTIPNEEWLYLEPRLDDEIKTMIHVAHLNSGVVVTLLPPYTHTDLMSAYGGIVQDTLDSEFEATDDTYHVEKNWDFYFS
ncbi:hypothetical protein, partial [Lacticaseibacillus chiayiensis]|uniref:hypothetical protein n=1 Tax=Lacticaseibacillus chiayiensis TaxID=2100821 RepID=UPI00102725B4